VASFPLDLRVFGSGGDGGNKLAVPVAVKSCVLLGFDRGRGHWQVHGTYAFRCGVCVFVCVCVNQWYLEEGTSSSGIKA
jgi:hypothetical protein